MMKSLLFLVVVVGYALFLPLSLEAQRQTQCNEQARSWNTFPKDGYLKGYSRYASRTIDSLPFVGKIEYVDVEPLQESKKLLSTIAYPSDEKRLGIEASFRLIVLITEQGKVGEMFIECVEGVQRQGEFQHFYEALQQGLQKTIFIPAVKNGKSVAAWAQITIPFRLR